MTRALVVMTGLLLHASQQLPQEKQTPNPHFDYDEVRTHELQPHRRTIPLKGVRAGFNQIHITLAVSPLGDVLDARADGESTEVWPEVQGEVQQWKFRPFEKDGKSVRAEVEEYIDLVPPERLPKRHVSAPSLKQDSKVAITLFRSGCFGMCPSYKVTVSTEGVLFEGGRYVVATGKHKGTVDPGKVRELARRFIAADFYSMDGEYRAGVTDNPTYVLTISVDGRTKRVLDYVGAWEGMPEVISDLEDAVDDLAETQRWIKGSDGLVEVLQGDGFDFRTYDSQVILKEAAARGETESVKFLLEAGVPLNPIPAPKAKESYGLSPVEHEGWLTAASGDPKTLKVLIEAEASKEDQYDKDQALKGAARSGKLDAVRALIAYGADPNAHLSKPGSKETAGDDNEKREEVGSILISAAESGNPEVVREILSYKPLLEARDERGKTAMFAAGEFRSNDVGGARVECVRLLAGAGADVNARDKEGNTPLHEIYLPDVVEELLKLGADLSVRNNEGETPIFTNVDDDVVASFIAHGADLTIRNNKGETVLEAAEHQGPLRQEALRKAIEKRSEP